MAERLKITVPAAPAMNSAGVNQAPNRYQLEVAEMDRRRRLTVRALSLLGAASLIMAALWSAGLPPAEGWRRAHHWIAKLSKPAAGPAAAVSPPQVPAAALPTGASGSAAAGLSGTDSSISPTPQPLYLIATTAGRNKNEGTASIGANADHPQTYVAGALLANGARIAEIHRDYVVLRRADSSARLSLYRRAGAPQAPERSALLSVGGEPPAPVMVAVSREVLTDYLRPSPVYDGEVLRGYQVYPGPKAGVFARLGLEPGDVITSINDAPLNDAPQAMEMFNQLTQGSAVVATLQRKGATRRITLQGALISAAQESVSNPAVQLMPPAGMPPI